MFCYAISQNTDKCGTTPQRERKESVHKLTRGDKPGLRVNPRLLRGLSLSLRLGELRNRRVGDLSVGQRVYCQRRCIDRQPRVISAVVRQRVRLIVHVDVRIPRIREVVPAAVSSPWHRSARRAAVEDLALALGGVAMRSEQLGDRGVVAGDVTKVGKEVPDAGGVGSPRRLWRLTSVDISCDSQGLGSL